MRLFETFPAFETENFRYRQIRPSDAEVLFHYASDPEVSRYTTWDPHRDIDESREVISMFLNHFETGEGLEFVIEDKATRQMLGLIGAVNMDTQNQSLEIGYWLGKEHWGKGIMTLALRDMIDFCFDRLKVVRIQACHFDENPASGRVMEKCGMRYEGLLHKAAFAKGRFWDVRLYAIIRSIFFT